MANSNSVPNNIYTVLVLVAMIALIAGIAFVVVRSNELFGTWNPADARDLSVLLPGKLGSLLS